LYVVAVSSNISSIIQTAATKRVIYRYITQNNGEPKETIVLK